MPDSTHDPIRDLENFGTGGLTVNPLDPAEVRRLGDRHRARQRASMLVAASAVAVVVSIVPIALVVGKDDAAPNPPFTTTTPTPTPTESPSVPAYGLGNIPETFPLDVDAPDYSGDGGEMKGPGPRVETSTPELCNHDAIADADPKGRLAFTSSGPEIREDRELRTFADDAAAEEVMTALRTDLDECSTWPSDATSPNGSTINLTVTRITAETGRDSETFAVTEVAPAGEGYAIGGTVYQVTRVGSAILTLAHNGEVSAQSAPSAGPEMIKTTRKITPEMCLFTTAGCASLTPPEAVRTFTYPRAMVVDEKSLDLLRGASEEFKRFILTLLPRAKANTEDCGGPVKAGVLVFRYSSAGYAYGIEFDGCDSKEALWALREGTWKLVLSVQHTWMCADLTRVGIPRAFVGGCATTDPEEFHAVGDFGPVTVDGIALHMTEAEVEAAGGTVRWPEGQAACGTLYLPGTTPDDSHADGVISRENGVVLIEPLGEVSAGDLAWRLWTTPEGVDSYSTATVVKKVYPNGEFVEPHNSWLVPLASGTHYRFDFVNDDQDTVISLEADDHGCYE